MLLLFRTSLNIVEFLLVKKAEFSDGRSLISEHMSFAPLSIKRLRDEVLTLAKTYYGYSCRRPIERWFGLPVKELHAELVVDQATGSFAIDARLQHMVRFVAFADNRL